MVVVIASMWLDELDRAEKFLADLGYEPSSVAKGLGWIEAAVPTPDLDALVQLAKGEGFKCVKVSQPSS